jgi:hypothetical protein
VLRPVSAFAGDDCGKKETSAVPAMPPGAQQSRSFAMDASFGENKPGDEDEIYSTLGHDGQIAYYQLQLLEMVLVDHYEDFPVRTWLTKISPPLM